MNVLLVKAFISIRIAGTIRGFRTFKFAQKDGLLAAFLSFFYVKKVVKREKKHHILVKKTSIVMLILYFISPKKSYLRLIFSLLK
jgi:hypothetical protein